MLVRFLSLGGGKFTNQTILPERKNIQTNYFTKLNRFTMFPVIKTIRANQFSRKTILCTPKIRLVVVGKINLNEVRTTKRVRLDNEVKRFNTTLQRYLEQVN